MIGETTLDCMRQNHKDRWVTADAVRNDCDRGGGYTRKVLEAAVELGIIDKKTEFRPVSLYRIDPKEGEIACPIEPEKPYEETICSQLEKTLDNCVLQNDEECKVSVLKVIDQSVEESLKTKDYKRARRLIDFAETVLRTPKGADTLNVTSIPVVQTIDQNT